jgi:type VI secretion system protein ImpJ
MHNKVIWLEGMFLQPQHLQQQERYFRYLIQQKSTSMPFFWGFYELEIDKTLLAIGKVGISQCSCVFPDGTYAKAPDVDLPPVPFAFNPLCSEENILYLAIPTLQNGLAEVCSKDTGTGMRYECGLVNVVDNTSEEIGTGVDIHVARLALKIMQGAGELSGYVYLPIARVSQVSPENAIILDDNFIPPFLDVKTNTVINQYLNEIFALLHHRATLLGKRIANIDEADSTATQDLMLLQLINVYESHLSALKALPKLRPFDLYLALSQLLAALSTYAQQDRRPPLINAYDHNSLEETFSSLVKHLKSALTVALNQNASLVPLVHQDSLWIAQILDESIFEADFILIATAQAPSEVLRQNLPAQLKIASVNDVYDLAAHALTGIPITPLAAVPQKVPYYANSAYFVLDKESPYWKNLSITAPIAIHQGLEYAGFNLELWAVHQGLGVEVKKIHFGIFCRIDRIRESFGRLLF